MFKLIESMRSHSLIRFVICIGAIVGASFHVTAQPSNNSCLTAIGITADLNIGSCNIYSTLGATDDITPSCDTAFCGGGPVNNLNTNVWFSFVAPSTGELTVNISAYTWNIPNYDPIVALYTACDSLSQIGCSSIDDDGNNQDGSKTVSFPALVSGNTYYISVDPPCSDSGTFCMQVDYLSHCLNGVQDFDETGIDCGGLQCPACPPNGITFQKAYGGTSNDYGTYAIQTFDGGYVMLGYTESFGQGLSDLYLVKTDMLGDTSWTRTYGDVGVDEGQMVEQTADSGYVLVGTTNLGPGGTCIYLIKVDNNGDSLWSRAYGSSAYEYGWSLKATTDGGFIICGSTNGLGAGGEAYLVKLNGVGDIMWSRGFGGTNSEQFSDVDQTNDGGYIMVGETMSFGSGGNDVYLVKTDSLGNLLWTRAYGNTVLAKGTEVIEVSTGGYLMTGYTDLGPGSKALYLIRTDANGDSLWSRTYGGVDLDIGSSLVENSSGEFVIVGYTKSFGQGLKDIYFLKVDTGGTLLIAKTFGDSLNDDALSVRTCNDGGYLICGNKQSWSNGNTLAFLIKTDANGNAVGCNQGNTSTSMQIPNTIVASTSTIVNSGAVDTVVSVNAGQTQTTVVKLNMDIVVSGSDATCFNANNGQATATVSCAAPPITYLWSDGQTTSTATGLQAGTYDLIISDSLGSMDSAVFSIFEPTQITPSFNSQYELCTGSDGGIYTWTNGGSSGNGPYSYLWSNGDSTANTIDVVAGMYYVTITDPGGCIVTDSVEVLYHEDTLNIAINSTPVICNGICSGSTDVSVSGGTFPYGYTWDDPGTQSTDTAISLCPGSYIVTVTDTFGCVGIDSIVVAVDSMPVQDLCMVTVDSTSTRNLIVWEKPSMVGIDYYNIYREVSTNVYVIIGSVPYLGLSEFVDTTNGVNPATTAYRYKISVVDTCGIENTLSGSHKTIHMVISVDIFGRPVLSWNDYEGVMIANYRILRDSTGTNIWQVLDSVPFGVNSWTDLSPPSSPNLTYLIEVVLPNTCTSTKVSTYNSTKSNSLLNGSFFNAVATSMDASASVCDGNVSVAANYGLLPYTYMWNTVPVQSTASVDSLCQGTYTVIVLDANGDTAIASATVNQPNSMAATLSSTNPTISNCDGLITVNVSAGIPPYTYMWNTSPVQSTSTIDSLCQGTYSVTVTDNLGDSIILTGSIVESVAPMSGSASSIYATIGNCDGSATVLVSGGGLPYTYLWNSIPPQTTATADSLCPGTYVVTAYDSLGDSISFTVTVIEATAPLTTATSSADASVATCDGTASVVASGGIPPYTYIWNDSLSQTTATAVGLCKGTYNVTVFDSGGNTVVAAVTVDGPPIGSPPITDFIASQVSIVVGQSIDYLDLTQNSPTSWVWLLSGASPSFSVDQNPTNITYNTVGCFDAQLAATNLAGTDTIFKTCYIDVGAVSIDEMGFNDAVKVYPNPSNGVFSIQIDNLNALDYTVIVNDLIGREVYKAEIARDSGKSSTSMVVDLSGQPLGIYELVVLSEGQKVVRKLVFK